MPLLVVEFEYGGSATPPKEVVADILNTAGSKLAAPHRGDTLEDVFKLCVEVGWELTAAGGPLPHKQYSTRVLYFKHKR